MKKDEKRQGEQLSTKKGKYNSTLDGLVSDLRSGKIQLSVLTTQERKDLDINSTGPYSLWDFLKSDPYRIGSQATARLIMKEAANRIRDNKRLERIAEKYVEFCTKKKPLKLAIRKVHTDVIEGLKGSFRWFVPKTDLHVCYFDEKSMLIASDVLSKAQLPKGIAFAFAAEVVLESNQASKAMREDLQDELYAARLFMIRMESELEISIKSLKELCGSCGFRAG